MGHGQASSSSTTFPAGIPPPRRSPGGSPPMGTTPSAPTSTPEKDWTSTLTTPPRRPAPKVGYPTSSFVGDAGGAIEALRCAAELQWQGRRHRLLLGRPPVVPHRRKPPGRRRGGLLRGLCDRDPPRRFPSQGGAAGRQDGLAALPLAGALRCRRPVPRLPSMWPSSSRRSLRTTRRMSSTATRVQDTPSSPPIARAFRPEAALDGWQRIFSWFEKYLATAEA